ncbi:MAG: gliding motility-associated C-terminal domain-containing protein [Bacteroidota bacterium]
MKKLITVSTIVFIQLLFVGAEKLLAQVMVNYGSIIYSANDTIFANGGISNLTNGQGTGTIGGTFRNSGEVYLTGDWTNTSNTAAFTDILGVDGASTIRCILVGGNQNITGNDVTQFHDLDLRGTGVKQLLGIDAIVNDTLELNDRELATDVNTMYVKSTSPEAIQFQSGFVSSLNGGSLERSTAGTSSYIFPVGSSVGTMRFRPVEITPDNASFNNYDVRMANVDATTEGFPVTQRQATMSRVNDLYYHQIWRQNGFTPASITVYYDPANDGPVTGLAHWQNAPQWEDIVSTPDLSAYNLNGTTKVSWDFSNDSEAFALMKLINECGEMFVPTAFSPDGNGENDVECVYGKCVKTIYFAIYDRWGEKVFETTDQSQCWDGTFRGKEMNTAVFVYYMKATLTTGEEVSKKGNISLLR